jgi:Flp pilus assembly pilin Flp
MPKFVKGFIRDERGEDLMEYGMLVAFIASIAVAAVISDPVRFGDALQTAYQRAVDVLNQA